MFAKWASEFKSHTNMLPLFDQQRSNNVGGAPGRTTPATRGVWTLATSRAYVHHNHVHHSDKHALDFDAYTGNSVAWENLCEDNKEQGIFVEETSHDNVRRHWS